MFIQSYAHIRQIQERICDPLSGQRHVAISRGIPPDRQIPSAPEQFSDGIVMQKIHGGIRTFTADGVIHTLIGNAFRGVAGGGDFPADRYRGAPQGAAAGT